MRTPIFLILFVLVALALVLPVKQVHATHAAGSNLTYTCLQGNTYQLELAFYRDCAGINAPTTAVVNYISPSCGLSGSVTLTRIPGTGNEITIPCPTSPSTCSGGNNPGIQEFIYRATVTLPSSCSDWTFSYRHCCRNNAITNMVNPGSQQLFVYSTLNNVVAPCNSSPIFTNPPVSFVCVNQSFTYNQGVIDLDGDSLAYSLVNPLDNTNNPIPYVPPFSASYPLTSTPGLAIDPITGDITMNPTNLEVTVISVLVSEYRNGVLIGTVVRDIIIWVINCSGNNLPVASGINGTNIYQTQVCINNPVCFDIFANDPDQGQTVTMTWNQGIPGASYTVSGSPLPTGTFCWTPTAANIQGPPHVFTVTVVDNACPISGVQTFSYSIFVRGLQVNLGPDVTTCGQAVTLTPTVVGGNGVYSYLWNTGDTTSSIIATASGSYSVSVTDTSGCPGTDQINVIIGSNISTTISAVGVSCNGSQNGTATAQVNGGTGVINYNWSNGGNTQTITGLVPGTYSVTVSDEIGCSATATTTITEPDPLVLNEVVTDVTCFGGSDGSITTNVSGGTAPYVYIWSNGSTDSGISGLTAGTYGVTVYDTRQCSVTGSFVVNEPQQINQDIIAWNDTTVCQGTDVMIMADGGFSSYLWSNGATTQSITVSLAGVYSVTATDANGCTAIDEAELITEVCCFPIDFPAVFTTIDASNNSVTDNAVWTGKIYVSENVTVSNSAVLDLTNVDIVFNEGTGITFTDGSSVRANNSVFRSCDNDKTWAGFSFEDASFGTINQSLFKHAEIAISVPGGGNVRISNNEFYNCNIGVSLSNAGQSPGYKEGITGNTFLFSENGPAYASPTYFGIKAMNTIISGAISQNNFVNNTMSAGTSNFYHGIYLNNSSATASSNTFTNMFRSLDLTGNAGSTSFENNVIEFTRESYFLVHPVRITNVTTSPVLIEGNKMTYSLTSLSSSNQIAMFVNNCRNLIFSKNTIDGFSVGIQVDNSQLITIDGNKLLSNKLYGVVSRKNEGMYIRNNIFEKQGYVGIMVQDTKLEMDIANNQIETNITGGVGIVFSLYTSGTFNNNNIKIAGNCVTNSLVALYTWTSVANRNLPAIRNNYFYNYSGYGIWNTRFVGSIGSCNSYPANIGRNSFISNYLPPFGTAMDVRSDNATIALSGNSPNLVISFPNVLVNTSCYSNSNAACGNQDTDAYGVQRVSPLGQLEIFRQFIESFYPLTLTADGYSLNNDYMAVVKLAENKAEMVANILDVLLRNDNFLEADKFFHAVVNSGLLAGNLDNWFAHSYYLGKNEYNNALVQLNTIRPESAVEAEKLAVERIRTMVLAQGRDARNLTENELQVLEMIDNNLSAVSPIARDMIQFAKGNHDYRFGDVPSFDFEYSAYEFAHQLTEDFIQIFPNPANAEVVIRYFSSTEVEKAELKVFNTLGKQVRSLPLEFNNGDIRMDVSDFAPGAYFITITNGKDLIQPVKLIKY